MLYVNYIPVKLGDKKGLDWEEVKKYNGEFQQRRSNSTFRPQTGQVGGHHTEAGMDIYLPLGQKQS